MAAPRVTFYVLAEADEAGRRRYACRLIEKAYQQRNAVLVRCASQDDARDLDEQLWRFSDRSFVPHELLGRDAIPTAPVCIMGDGQPPASADVLVNLAPDVPPWFDRFGRVAEFVGSDEASRSAGRERYRFYRDHDIEPETHDTGAR